MSRIAAFLVLLGMIPVLTYAGMTAGYRLDIISLGDLFGAMRGWLGKALFAGTAILLIGMLVSFLGRRAGLGILALLFTAGSGAVLYSLIEMKRIGGEVPRIHDLSTDTLDPPLFVSTATERKEGENPAAYDGTQSAPQIEYYPDLKTIVVEGEQAEIVSAVERALKAVGVKNISMDSERGHVEGTATTLWFGFKDDVVVRVRSGEDGKTLIDIRSKSRVGISDLGANAERIRQIRENILAELESAA